MTSSGTRMLMVDMGRSFRNRFRTRLFTLIVFPFESRGRTRRDDADGVGLTDDMDDEEQSPVFGEPDSSLPRLALAASICQTDEGIKNLTGFLEADAVLAQVRGSFRGVPFKGLAMQTITHIHQKQAYIRCRSESSNVRRSKRSAHFPPKVHPVNLAHIWYTCRSKLAAISSN